MWSNKKLLINLYLFLNYYVQFNTCEEENANLYEVSRDATCVEAAPDDHRCVCRVPTSRRETDEPQPLLLLHPGTGRGAPKIMYPEPTSPGVVVIPRTLGSDSIGGKVRVTCIGEQLTVKKIEQGVRSAFIACHNRTHLRLASLANEITTFRDIGCTREPQPIARLRDSSSCAGRGPSGICYSLEVGFQLNLLDFVPTIELLTLDVETLQPLVASAQILPTIESRQTGRAAWTFRRGPIFREHPQINFNEIYRREYQRRRFLEIFGDPQVANKYVSEIGDAYLTEGQLITERDLYYRSEQGSVYLYENVVPIWRGIAAGNWELAGELVRKLAGETGAAGLRVWSGAIGVLALSDYRGSARRIYLTEGRHGQPLIPVPKLLYKYVYDAERHRGLVLITVNDPHLIQGLTSDLVVCRERRVCHSMHPQLASTERGYTYCCSLDDFARIAHHLELPLFPRASSLA